jgi:uncharacterized protein YciI
MLFAVMGFFKPGVDTAPAHLQADLNEHLAQPAMNVRLAGYLKDAEGRRTGLMAILDVDSHARAQAYLHASPYFIAGLYERCEVAEYDLELGRLG